MSVKIIKDKEGKDHYVLVEEKEPKKDYWVRIPQKWWRRDLQGLRPVERCIMVSLRIWGKRKPTKSQLARELATTRKTIAKYLKILKKKGLIG